MQTRRPPSSEETPSPGRALLRPGAMPGCPRCGRRQPFAQCEACGAAIRVRGLEVVRLLGESRGVRTYLAIEAIRRRKVVLRELALASVPDAERVDAFSREAQLLGRVGHRRVPRLLAAFQEGERAQARLYLAQEFFPGRSLHALVRERRLTESEALHVARQVLRVLRVLHGMSPQVVHRDLRPSNLIVQPDGSIGLVGFGTARFLELGLTHESTLVGQFGYAPLEQLGGTVSPRSDLHALGATLLHAVTGTPPDELVSPDSARLELPRQLPGSPVLRGLLRGLAGPGSGFASAEEAYAFLMRAPRRQQALREAGPYLAGAALGGGLTALLALLRHLLP